MLLSRSDLICTQFYWWWLWVKTHPIINCQFTQIVRKNDPACKSVTRASCQKDWKSRLRRRQDVLLAFGKKREFANNQVFYTLIADPINSSFSGVLYQIRSDWWHGHVAARNDLLKLSFLYVGFGLCDVHWHVHLLTYACEGWCVLAVCARTHLNDFVLFNQFWCMAKHINFRPFSKRGVHDCTCLFKISLLYLSYCYAYVIPD